MKAENKASTIEENEPKQKSIVEVFERGQQERSEIGELEKMIDAIDKYL